MGSCGDTLTPTHGLASTRSRPNLVPRVLSLGRVGENHGNKVGADPGQERIKGCLITHAHCHISRTVAAMDSMV